MTDRHQVIVAAAATDTILEAVTYEVDHVTLEDGAVEYVRLTLELGLVDLQVDFDHEEATRLTRAFEAALERIGPDTDSELR